MDSSSQKVECVGFRFIYEMVFIMLSFTIRNQACTCMGIRQEKQTVMKLLVLLPIGLKMEYLFQRKGKNVQ